MVIILILGFLLILSTAILETFYTTGWTYQVVSTVYRKEKALILLNSALKRVIYLFNKDNNSYDALTELWAKPLQLKTPLGILEIEIIDQDRFINLNYVGRNRKITKAFERLLSFLHIDNELIEKLEHWNGAKKPEGEWNLPFPLKGKPLDSIYELFYFWNNTKDLYGKKVGVEKLPGLIKLVTVYSDGKININTAPYWILRSLDDDIDDILARNIMEERRKNPFRSPRDLLRVDGINMDILYRIYNIVKVKSRFFEIKITLKGVEGIHTLRVIYDRNLKKVVEREFN